MSEIEHPLTDEGASPLVVHQHVCPLCEAACGLEITVQNNEVRLIRGDRNDVFSRGYLCPKGTALKELQSDPDRLRTPLIKRDGEFVEATFDEAFAEIERRLIPIREQYGAQSCGIVIGNPTVHRTGLVLYALDLASALGSPNVFSAATLDQMPKQLAVGRMYGDFYSIPVPDIEQTDLLIVIGANPVVSNGSMWSVPDFRGKARALKARGGRIVTIDPRRTETAELADIHHHIKPGGDVYLLAAIVNTLFSENLVRLGKLDQLVAGVEDLRSAVSPVSAEWAANRCGISAHDIRQLARDIAAAKRAAVYGRLGTCLTEYATVNGWLIEVINILTGHLDEPGGSMFAKAPAFANNATGPMGSGPGVTTGTYHSRVSGAPEVMGQFPITCLAEEITTPGDGQLRALITIASNAARSGPNSTEIEEALAQLDFLVSVDIYLNETTRHADVILPSPSPLEEPHYDVYFSQFAHRNVARFSEPTLDRADGVPEDWELMLRLIAIARGKGSTADLDELDNELTKGLLSGQAPEIVDAILGELAGHTGALRRLDLSLRSGPYGDLFGFNPDGLTLAKLKNAPSGIDLGPLAPRMPDILRTPSGHIELAPSDFVQSLRTAIESGNDPSNPETCTDANASLIGRRDLRSNNSWMHNLRVLTKGRDRCTMMVHPDDALLWGLSDSSRAVVSATGLDNQRSIEVTIEVTDSMMRGVISLPHGWGHDQPGAHLQVANSMAGPNFNELTSTSRRDLLSGNAVLNGIAVRVSPLQPAQSVQPAQSGQGTMP